MQRLILRLGNDLESPVHWLVYNESEKEIIASGELPSATSLDSLKEHADNSKVVALVPSSSVLLTSVTLPPNANRKVLSAIPFMLEEDVSSDINEQFVALGQREADTQHLAVVAKEKVIMWQSWLKEADIFCDAMYPDALALPTADNTITLLQLEQQLIVRFSDHQGMEGEAEWLLPLVLAKAKQEEKHIQCYSEIDNLDEDAHEDLVFDYQELPLRLFSQHINETSINLLQGDFAVKREGNRTWQKWKLVATLAAVALVVNMVAKSIELNSIKSQRLELNANITETIEQAFPNIGAYRQARVAVQNEMRRLEQAGGGLGMLAIMSQLSGAFANSGVAPQTLRYDATRTELRMQSVADNFESLERFRREVQALGFEVDQGAINNQGDQVVGVVIVRG